MPTATLTSKGQITLPKKVREQLRVEPGDAIDFVIGAMAADAGCEETATFDRRLRNAAGFRVL